MEKFMKILKNKDGVALVMMALMITVFLGFSALAVDVGAVAYTKAKLQNAADAAALAGAHDLPDLDTAEGTAMDYAKLNGVEHGVEQTVVLPDAGYDGDPKKIKVECKRTVPYIFAKVLGLPDPVVEASAVAQRSGGDGVSGLRPWALDDEFDYEYGDELILKNGAGDGTTGYYGVVAFGSQNANAASVYSDNVEFGYGGIVNIGDIIKQGQGNNNNVKAEIAYMMDDGTDDYTDLTALTKRVVLVPKIDADTLEVIGFAAMYLEIYAENSGKKYSDLGMKAGELRVNILYDTTWSEEYKEEIENEYEWVKELALFNSIKLVE